MEGDAGMELQRLIAEKKALLYNSQKRGIFTSVKHRFTLCPVGTWRKGTIDTNQPPHYTDILSPECKVFGENICKKSFIATFWLK